jgi:hypothetical protein
MANKPDRSIDDMIPDSRYQIRAMAPFVAFARDAHHRGLHDGQGNGLEICPLCGWSRDE